MKIVNLLKFVALSVMFLGLAACGGDTSVDATDLPVDDAAVDPAQSGASSQLFQVEGVDVDPASSAVERPEVASQVEFSGTLIDSGEGFEFCVGVVLESLPPQCSGFIVQGLESSGWAHVEGGVAFGERTVVVSWPPNSDNAVQLVSDRLFEQPVVDPSTPFPLPDMCEGLDWQETVDIEVLSNWADQNSDKAGLAYFSRDVVALETELEVELGTELSEEELLATESELVNQVGIGVLQVVEGEAEAAREELADGDLVPCIEEVQFSASELRAAQDQLDEIQGEAFITGSSSGAVDNRLNVIVAVADLQTVRLVADQFEDRSILRMNAAGVIVQ